MKSKLKWFVDFLMGGPAPEPQGKEIVLPAFHPIIFANGRDDDTDGIKAFWENRPVIYAGEEIKPGQSRQLVGLHLNFSCTAIFIHKGERLVEIAGYPMLVGRSGCSDAVHVHIDHDVKRRLGGCSLTFNCPVEA
ncbi:hypothetical protein [Sinorhizobium fredii]|uniref:hypothetical protein n=1 Tax=Rhizobium fredii TaxID=380 RepID=UPI003513CD3F